MGENEDAHTHREWSEARHAWAGCRLTQANWEVLIQDHHSGYIEWDEYQANQMMIADNANMKGAMVRGSVKRGSALLAGLLRCGHCGRKLHVTYCGAKAGVVRYNCRGSLINHGSGSCISFGGLRADQLNAREVLAILQPLGLRAAVNAIDSVEAQTDDGIRQKELSLSQARFEVTRARRQYDAVDPENRLLASELERRWNDALGLQSSIEVGLAKLQCDRPGALTEGDKSSILEFGADLQAVWNDPSSSRILKSR